jgi:hypothetical protein
LNSQSKLSNQAGFRDKTSTTPDWAAMHFTDERDPMLTPGAERRLAVSIAAGEIAAVGGRQFHGGLTLGDQLAQSVMVGVGPDRFWAQHRA